VKYDRVIRTSIRLINAPEYTAYRGTLDIRNLRISFSISKSISWSTNTATVRIWNLSPENRNQIANFGDELTLYAGYANDGGAQLLFVGDTTQVSHSFPQPEIVSTLTCGDGDKIVNNVTISVSFGANTPVATVIQKIADLMGMKIVSGLPTILEVYALGFKGTNLARNVLDNACQKANLWWSVQNGNLVIQRKNQGNSKPPVDINVNTGMIGVPERYTDKKGEFYVTGPKDGWKVRTLLRPDIIPGDVIRLKSSQVPVDGLFFVETIQHEGDNYGPSFESTMEVIAL
jgi:hypothetical protein